MEQILQLQTLTVPVSRGGDRRTEKLQVTCQHEYVLGFDMGSMGVSGGGLREWLVGIVHSCISTEGSLEAVFEQELEEER